MPSHPPSPPLRPALHALLPNKSLTNPCRIQDWGPPERGSEPSLPSAELLRDGQISAALHVALLLSSRGILQRPYLSFRVHALHQHSPSEKGRDRTAPPALAALRWPCVHENYLLEVCLHTGPRHCRSGHLFDATSLGKSC